MSTYSVLPAFIRVSLLRSLRSLRSSGHNTRLLLPPDRIYQGLKHGVGYRDDLGCRLVGLLKAHQVRRLLVEIDAGDGVARLGYLLEQAFLGDLVDLRAAGGRAHVGHQLAVGALIGSAAVGQREL